MTNNENNNESKITRVDSPSEYNELVLTDEMKEYYNNSKSIEFSNTSLFREVDILIKEAKIALENISWTIEESKLDPEFYEQVQMPS